MYTSHAYVPGQTITLRMGGSEQLLDLGSLLNAIDQVLLKHQCDRKVVWNMFQVDRLGHTVFEPEAIKVIFGVDFADLVILLPRSRSVCNQAIFKFATAGAQLLWVEEEWLVHVMHGCRECVERGERQYILMGGCIYEAYSQYLANGGLAGGYSVAQLDFLATFEPELRLRYGLTEGQKVVVIHNREAGWFSSSYHDHRNSSIGNFGPSILELVSKGYVVVRIGDPTMIRLGSINGVIDLPFDERKQELDDIIFIKLCEFYVGSTSGPYDLARWLKKPLLAHNIAELPAPIDNQFMLFKGYYHRSFKRTLSYLEIFTSRAGYVTHVGEFLELGISLIENSPEELLIAIREMIRYTTHGFSEDDMALVRHLSKLNQVIAISSNSDEAKFADRVFGLGFVKNAIPSLAYRTVDSGFISLI